jgi:hypothetical protein
VSSQLPRSDERRVIRLVDLWVYRWKRGNFRTRNFSRLLFDRGQSIRSVWHVCGWLGATN